MSDTPLKPRNMRERGHYTIDNEMVDDGWAAKIGATAYLVYSALCRHANVDTAICDMDYVNNPKIAENTGLSRKTVINVMKVLKSFNMITFLQKGGGRKRPNEIQLLHKSCWNVNAKRAKKGENFTLGKGVKFTSFQEKKGVKNDSKKVNILHHPTIYETISKHTDSETIVFETNKEKEEVLKTEGCLSVKEENPEFPELIPVSEFAALDAEEQLTRVHKFLSAYNRKNRKLLEKNGKDCVITKSSVKELVSSGHLPAYLPKKLTAWYGKLLSGAKTRSGYTRFLICSEPITATGFFMRARASGTIVCPISK